MHVQKFEADSMDEALKAIRLELGPDAIILKTVTSKALGLKKKRIEITAAISERDLERKGRVDEVLPPKEREQFYKNKSSDIQDALDRYENYSSMGKAKPVKSVQNNIKEKELTNFLKSPSASIEVPRPVNTSVSNSVSNEYHLNLENRIRQLEDKLTKLAEKTEVVEFSGINYLSGYLRSQDVHPDYIQRIIKKIMFQLSSKELENEDQVQEVALREMLSMIQVKMPLFSNVDNKNVVTFLLSEVAAGQTSMALKLAVCQKNAVVIRMESTILDKNSEFAERMFNFPVIVVRNVSELAAKINQAISEGKSVVIDYKNRKKDTNEIMQLIGGLRRSLDNLEVLTIVSAIHSETYNRKILQNYAQITDGIIINFIDLCVNFGNLFNLADFTSKMPITFFGTGKLIPDDLETATSERILAGMFKL